MRPLLKRQTGAHQLFKLQNCKVILMQITTKVIENVSRLVSLWFSSFTENFLPSIVERPLAYDAVTVA